MDTKELRRLAQAATPGPWKNSRAFELGPISDADDQSYGIIIPIVDVYGDNKAADIAYIAAANPAAIIEILDRLEATEEDRSNFLVEMGKLCAQCDALRLRIEAVEKERDIDEERIVDLMANLNRVGHENEALRASLEVAEKNLSCCQAEREEAASLFLSVKTKLLAERDELRAELSKQRALTDAAQHIAGVAQSRANRLQTKIAELEQQDPVAWRTFDGEGGYDYRSYEDNENYKLGWDARNPNHIGWVEPLYTLHEAKGEEKCSE